MQTTTLRSGGSTVLRLVGVVFVVFGVLALAGTAILIATDAWPAAGGIIGSGLGMLILVVGVVLLALGIRNRAVIDGQGIGWAPVFGARQFIPWEQVREVRVPGDADPATSVQLVMRDGSTRPVEAISKPRNGETHRYWASQGYLRAGQTVVDAHRAWLAAASR